MPSTLSRGWPPRSPRTPIADLATRYYCLSLLDKHHQPDITLERGMELLNLCADELKRRLPIDFKGLIVKVVTKDGIKEMAFDNDKVVKGT